MNRPLKFFLRTVVILFVLANFMVALHAYKLTHVYDASTMKLKHETEKTSWDKTKDILFGLNATKLVNKYTPDSTVTKVLLTTKDSLKLEGWYFKTDSTPKGTVILFHGHHSNKTGVLPESGNLLKLGYNTLLIDFRAHGGSEGNTTSIGYYEAEDVKLAYDYIQSLGEKNTVLWGVSMGAAAITKAVNDHALRPSKIILEMPFGSLLDAVEGKLSMMHLPQEPLATMLTFWGGIEHGFWAFNMKPSAYAKKITAPVLLQWGKNDPRVTKKEIDEIYANIATDKKLVVYEECGHESLCAKENNKWITEIRQFLQQ
ncbi:alpha/beta hydrolase [Ferruginibacter sp. SUN002]|uniref:alpha/beta hydrolase n=1 Tax=Ferruginibacter sp. SUN002 TaxID=2937789 RepID=UPI003D3695AC